MAAAGDDGFSFLAFDRFAERREFASGVGDAGGDVGDPEPVDAEVDELGSRDSGILPDGVDDGFGLREHGFAVLD